MGAILLVRNFGARRTATALLAACLWAPPAHAAATPECFVSAGPAEVVDAPDPRSLQLADGRSLRLAGLETFALLLADGDPAEAALRQRVLALAGGRGIAVAPVSEKPDRYGRLPALVALDAALLQETLAREGVAIAFASGEPLPCFERLLAAEEEARRARRGFWSALAVPRARPEALRPRIGRFAIFEGRVISVGTRRTRTYLNFGGRWSEDVTVEIEARHRERFGGEAKLAEFSGRRVRVRGFVEDRGGPMVAVSSPMQVETLSGPPGTSGSVRGITP